jgi:hypothetical protein
MRTSYFSQNDVIRFSERFTRKTACSKDVSARFSEKILTFVIRLYDGSLTAPLISY